MIIGFQVTVKNVGDVFFETQCTTSLLHWKIITASHISRTVNNQHRLMVRWLLSCRMVLSSTT